MKSGTRITGALTFTDRATAKNIANNGLNNPSNQLLIQNWLNNIHSCMNTCYNLKTPSCLSEQDFLQLIMQIYFKRTKWCINRPFDGT